MENSDNGYQAHQPVQQTVIVQQEQKKIKWHRDSRVRPRIDWAFLVLNSYLGLDYLAIRAYLFCYWCISYTSRIGDSGIMH